MLAQLLSFGVVSFFLSFPCLGDPLVSSSYAEKDGLYIFPPFDIKVTLTKEAQKQLIDLGERVKMLVSVDNLTPSLPGQEPVKESIGQQEIFLPASGGTAHIDEWKITFKEKGSSYPRFLVNVMSARDKCKFNLLSCSIYSGPYPTKEKKTIKIKCDILNKRPHCN